MVIYFEEDLGTAENVACIVEAEGDSWGDHDGAVVADIDELLETHFCVTLGVEGLYGWEVFLGESFVEPLGVTFLDVSTVCEHDLAEVARGECRVDVTFESSGGEIG